MTISFSKFNVFVADINNKVHNLGSDTLKVMLSDSAPVATNAIPSDITEITAHNGYSAGGAAVTSITSTQTSGTYKLVGTGPTVTASGGTVGPFRYIVLYNNTATKLIGYYDRGAELTLADGDAWVCSFDGTNGIFQLA